MLFSKLSPKVYHTYLEACWTPIYKLHSLLRLDCRNGGVDIFGCNVAPVQQTNRHVLSVARITFDHLVFWIKAGFCDLGDHHPVSYTHLTLPTIYSV